jgi:hypothetical protein
MLKLALAAQARITAAGPLSKNQGACKKYTSMEFTLACNDIIIHFRLKNGVETLQVVNFAYESLTNTGTGNWEAQ